MLAICYKRAAPMPVENHSQTAAFLWSIIELHGDFKQSQDDRIILPFTLLWIDEDKRDDLDGEVGIVGFEIPFNRHFYVFQPPRSLGEIDRDLKACTDRIKQMIEELSA
jgi:hypothetical protein